MFHQSGPKKRIIHSLICVQRMFPWKYTSTLVNNRGLFIYIEVSLSCKQFSREFIFPMQIKEFYKCRCSNTVNVFLVFRNLYAYVCIITLTYQISHEVINETFCMGHLLIMVNVVGASISANTNQWILNYLLKHILEDSVLLVDKVIPKP